MFDWVGACGSTWLESSLQGSNIATHGGYWKWYWPLFYSSLSHVICVFIVQVLLYHERFSFAYMLCLFNRTSNFLWIINPGVSHVWTQLLHLIKTIRDWGTWFSISVQCMKSLQMILIYICRMSWFLRLPFMNYLLSYMTLFTEKKLYIEKGDFDGQC